jgi:hypothetical protein
MSELLIQRIIDRKNLMRKFSNKRENFILTDDESLLTNMHDVRMFETDQQLEEHITKHKSYFNKNRQIERDIRNAFLSKKTVVHKIFGSRQFLNHLDEFMSLKENRDLETECLWNVALYYAQTSQEFYKPSLNTLFGFLTQDITELHENIEKFVEIHFQKNEKFNLEMPFKVSTRFTLLEAKLLNKDNHCVSIAGRLDLFKPDTNELYEIKASMLSSWSQEWLVQTLAYALFLGVQKYKVEKIYIVNVLKGLF